MSASLIRASRDKGVAEIVLNRPDKRNALSRELIEQLLGAVQSASKDESARVLVLAAEGPAFCAGMDLAEMQDRAKQSDAEAQWQRDAEAYRELVEAIFNVPVPTVAVVQGPALAGGVGLVAACDVVLAADTAFFSLPEPKRGITAAVVAPLLIYRVGPGAAGYMLLSTARVAADEARRFGLCHKIAPAADLESHRVELVDSILGSARSALVRTKRHLLDCAASNLKEQLDRGMRISADARHTVDAREGLAAFLEKRPPAWALPTPDPRLLIPDS